MQTIRNQQVRLTLHQWQGKYEGFIANVATRNTYHRYSYALENFFGKFKDKRYPEEISRLDIEDFRTWRQRDGVSPRTVNFEVSVVRSFYNWMIDMHEQPFFNPCSKVRKLKEPKEQRKAQSVDTVERIFKACTTDWEKFLVTLAVTTGMRGNEMATLEWDDVDFVNKRLTLKAKNAKTSKGRTIPLRSDLVDLFVRIKDAKSPSHTGCVPITRVFRGWAGGGVRHLQQKWYALLVKAGVPKIGLHAMRHTFATFMLRNGLDLATVSSLLGHADIKTTALYLTPADSETCRDALTKLPGIQEVVEHVPATPAENQPDIVIPVADVNEPAIVV